MISKHTGFSDSEVMRELEKQAIKEKGPGETEIVKQASSITEYSPTNDLFSDIISLARGLRAKGYEKEAKSLENKLLIYKTAETHLYKVFEEEGEDLIDFSHEEGDVEIAPSKGGYGKVETQTSQQKKIRDIVEKKPTGKLAGGNPDGANKSAVKFAQRFEFPEQKPTKVDPAKFHPTQKPRVSLKEVEGTPDWKTLQDSFNDIINRTEQIIKVTKPPYLVAEKSAWMDVIKLYLVNPNVKSMWVSSDKLLLAQKLSDTDVRFGSGETGGEKGLFSQPDVASWFGHRDVKELFAYYLTVNGIRRKTFQDLFTPPNEPAKVSWDRVFSDEQIKKFNDRVSRLRATVVNQLKLKNIAQVLDKPPNLSSKKSIEDAIYNLNGLRSYIQSIRYPKTGLARVRLKLITGMPENYYADLQDVFDRFYNQANYVIADLEQRIQPPPRPKRQEQEYIARTMERATATSLTDREYRWVYDQCVVIAKRYELYQNKWKNKDKTRSNLGNKHRDAWTKIAGVLKGYRAGAISNISDIVKVIVSSPTLDSSSKASFKNVETKEDLVNAFMRELADAKKWASGSVSGVVKTAGPPPPEKKPGEKPGKKPVKKPGEKPGKVQPGKKKTRYEDWVNDYATKHKATWDAVVDMQRSLQYLGRAITRDPSILKGFTEEEARKVGKLLERTGKSGFYELGGAPDGIWGKNTTTALKQAMEILDKLGITSNINPGSALYYTAPNKAAASAKKNTREIIDAFGKAGITIKPTKPEEPAGKIGVWDIIDKDAFSNGIVDGEWGVGVSVPIGTFRDFSALGSFLTGNGLVPQDYPNTIKRADWERAILWFWRRAKWLVSRTSGKENQKNIRYVRVVEGLWARFVKAITKLNKQPNDIVTAEELNTYGAVRTQPGTSTRTVPGDISGIELDTPGKIMKVFPFSRRQIVIPHVERIMGQNRALLFRRTVKTMMGLQIINSNTITPESLMAVFDDWSGKEGLPYDPRGVHAPSTSLQRQLIDTANNLWSDLYDVAIMWANANEKRLEPKALGTVMNYTVLPWRNVIKQDALSMLHSRFGGRRLRW